MAEIGYLIGPTRLHVPHEFEGEPSREPGYGPRARSLCGLFTGGVYAGRSGECNCGAYAEDHEADMLCSLFFEWARRSCGCGSGSRGTTAAGASGGNDRRRAFTRTRKPSSSAKPVRPRAGRMTDPATVGWMIVVASLAFTLITIALAWNIPDDDEPGEDDTP